jgi:hypothetical protein
MNTERSNELMNKSNEIFEKCSQRVSAILKDTNWKVECVDPTYKGANISISLDGERDTMLALVWKAQTERSEEYFTIRGTETRPFYGTNLATEVNFNMEAGRLLSNIEAIKKIKEAAKDFVNELNALEEEYPELLNEEDED